MSDHEQINQGERQALADITAKQTQAAEALFGAGIAAALAAHNQRLEAEASKEQNDDR